MLSRFLSVYRPHRAATLRRLCFVDLRLFNICKFAVHSRCRTRMDSPRREYNTEFFNYTSGRFLFGEQEQLDERYKEFCIPALQDVTVKVTSGTKCVHMSKLAEGTFNKVFLLTMDSGEQRVARIPHPNAGSKKYTTASEVATLHYLRTRLNMPVPEVFAYSCDENNSVGSEYIIMEKVEGEPLHLRWDSMTIEQKRLMVEQIAQLQSRLLQRPFSCYGNLYFTRDMDSSACSSQLDDNNSDDDSLYCIGPSSSGKFWDTGRNTTSSNNGPCIFHVSRCP